MNTNQQTPAFLNDMDELANTLTSILTNLNRLLITAYLQSGNLRFFRIGNT